MRSKTEILSEMRELQSAYSKVAAELKVITSAEAEKERQERQLARLADYKTKYNFLVQADGSSKAIDWEEIEKLIRSSFEQKSGYALGFDQLGMEGLGTFVDEGSTSFMPMVEDEIEVKRYLDRELRRQKFAEQAKVRK